MLMLNGLKSNLTNLKKKEKKEMIKSYRDIIVLLITTGVLILLGTIIIGDYIVALEENRPVDESVITLMKMSVTGLIGVIGGYIGGSK
jgi:di/tricarboxylate transporter